MEGSPAPKAVGRLPRAACAGVGADIVTTAPGRDGSPGHRTAPQCLTDCATLAETTHARLPGLQRTRAPRHDWPDGSSGRRRAPCLTRDAHAAARLRANVYGT